MRLSTVLRRGVSTSAHHFRQSRWLLVPGPAIGFNNQTSYVAPHYTNLRLPDVRRQVTKDQPTAPLGGHNGRSIGVHGPIKDRRGLNSVRVSTDVHPLQDVQSCHFSSLPLDRAGALRSDTSTISELLQRDDTKIVLFLNGHALVLPYEEGLGGSFCSSRVPVDAEGKTASYVPAIVTSKEVPLGSENPDSIFLGIYKKDNTAVFAYNAKEMPVEFSHALPIDVRKTGPQMCAEDASILALSSGLFTWHSNTQFCSRTGDRASEIILSGHGRRVKGGKNTSRSLYPRIDPAVIVGAMHGDWFLLGRKASWKYKRYSLLAGFVEVGESLEAACIREVKEESGITLDPSSIKYHSSQPWPFPQSLMVGFTAQTRDIGTASSGFNLLSKKGQQVAKHVGILDEEINAYRSDLTLPAINCDQDELEDARWFHRSWLNDRLNGGTNEVSNMSDFHIPGKHALANRLIRGCIKNLSRDAESEVPVHNIHLDNDSKMKYILLRVSFVSVESERRTSTLIIRGDPRAAYHNHIFTAAKNEMSQIQGYVGTEVLGGGRIEVCSEDKSIQVYGFSSAFSQAPHEITACILRTSLPFHSIDVSYDGY